jgi:cell division protease FtsH
MSEKLGPLALGKNEEELFLGREVTKHTEYSEKTAQVIDEEIRLIVQSGMDRAERLLIENIDQLHRLSKELLEREILDAEEINKILKGEELPPSKRNNHHEDKANDSDDVPEHVKKLMEEKQSKEQDSNTENKSSESNNE